MKFQGRRQRGGEPPKPNKGKRYDLTSATKEQAHRKPTGSAVSESKYWDWVEFETLPGEFEASWD